MPQVTAFMLYGIYTGLTILVHLPFSFTAFKRYENISDIAVSATKMETTHFSLILRLSIECNL
jgi:hypothetical protein